MKAMHCLFLPLLSFGTFTAATRAPIPARDLSSAALAWNTRQGEAAKSTVYPVQHPALDGQGMRFDTLLPHERFTRLIALSQLSQRGGRLPLEAHCRFALHARTEAVPIVEVGRTSGGRFPAPGRNCLLSKSPGLPRGGCSRSPRSGRRTAPQYLPVTPALFLDARQDQV